MADDLIRRSTGPLPASGTGPLTTAPATVAPVAAVVAPAAAQAAAPRDTAALTSGTGPLSTAQLGQPLQAVVAQAAPPAGPPPFEQIEAETAAVEEARAAVTELETELAEAMARFGPALTADQQQTFITTFKAEHAQAYQDLATAQGQLAGTIDANQDAMVQSYLLEPNFLDAVFGSDRDVVLDALKALGPEHALTVTDFAAKALASPEAARQNLGNQIVTELVQPHMAALAGAAVAAQGDIDGAGEAAIDALQASLGVALQAYMANAGDLAASLGGSAQAAMDQVELLADSLADLGRVFKADPAYFSDQLSAYAEEWGQKGGLGRVMASAGLIMGIMGCSAAAEQGLTEAISAYSQNAQDACQLLLGIEQVTKAVGPRALSVGTRLVPALGAIANAANAWTLAERGDLMSYGAAGGEAMAAVGGLMIVFGVGTGGVGPALVAVGTLASIGFQSLGEWQQQQGLDAEYREILTDPAGMGFDPELVMRMLQVPPGYMQTIADEYNLPIDQLPTILQEPGMTDLLISGMPLGGLRDDWGNASLQFLNQHFRGPDGKIDGAAYLDFVRRQRAAAGDLPGAEAFAYTNAQMREMSRTLGNPGTPEEWAIAFNNYEAWLDGAEHLTPDQRDLAKAHLKVMREEAAA